MLRMMAYSEPWYIESPRIFRSRPIFSTLLYSGSEPYFQPCQASRIKRFKKTMQILFALFSNTSNWGLRETTDIKIKLVFKYSGIFRHNRIYLGAMLGHSVQLHAPGLTQDIQNSDKCRTLIYSEPCHIHNLHILRTLVCKELWYTWSHSQTS